MDRRQFMKAGMTLAGSLLIGCRASVAPKTRSPERAMKFLNYAKYRDLSKIASARKDHFAYADRLREGGGLAIGGPLVDDEGKRIGLLFVLEAASRQAALTIAQEDPFDRAGGLLSYEITEWRLRGVNLELLAAANRAADRAEKAPVRLFANYAKYGADRSKLAMVRQAHWDYDRTLKSAGKLALAGPFANDEGGLFVYRATSRGEARTLLEKDPFAIEGVFAENELLEWIVEGVNPALLTSDFQAT